ncbi:S-layer homology domain-containing protein [Paenisporosarcina indica]|uniref:S-layer homology domain-containing protein n=1 Tax=Paenisporosarcina indica TaxID=650093 RepID=UPI00095009D2|nr:S-layer homology domain-containing protein [Paenisporosarcina indica]
MFKSYKTLLATSLVAVMALFAIVPSASAAQHKFIDVNPNYDEAVSFLYEFELIKGKTPTTFGTDLNLTRGDAAVILANVLGLDVKNAPDAGFKDLNSRVKGSVNALTKAGIISGITKEKFGPDLLLSRGAMAKFLNLGFGLEDFATPTPFTDAVGVFAPHIEALYGTEITGGKTPTTFGTNLNIKRGEFANLLYRSIIFSMYFPYAESVTILNPTTVEIKLTEAAPEEITAAELAGAFYIEAYYTDGSDEELTFAGTALSADRTTLTVELSANNSLVGKKGTLVIDGDIEIDFDYETPVAHPIETK